MTYYCYLLNTFTVIVLYMRKVLLHILHLKCQCQIKYHNNTNLFSQYHQLQRTEIKVEPEDTCKNKLYDIRS